eukprot:11187317-Lingulodinium_polyedra.AAC.1
MPAGDLYSHVPPNGFVEQIEHNILFVEQQVTLYAFIELRTEGCCSYSPRAGPCPHAACPASFHNLWNKL